MANKNEVATTKKELASAERIEFTPEQVQLIKSLISPKASDDELNLFLYQCRRSGLDPLTRQIYAIHRWNTDQGKEVMTIQTSIDGFRVIAERSGDYAGQDEPEFTYDSNGKLQLCKVRVYRWRDNIRYQAAVGVAHWAEYVQKKKDGNPTKMWAAMPHVMLAKVAEAVALRKAYPQDLSGLYTSEEMSQADKNEDTGDAPFTVEKTTLKETPAAPVQQDPATVSDHNHATIGTTAKPLLPNKKLMTAVERIKNGEIELYDKVIESYTLESGQKSVLDTVYKQAKEGKQKAA
jgi:phage recombination protein Bet